MNRKTFTRLALGAAVSLAMVPAAFAQGTLAGADVDNTATVDYEVGGVNQPDVPSNTDSFKVDRRVLFTVSEVGGAYTDVAPGASNQALKFTVTNNTNEIIDIGLAFAQDSGSGQPHGGTEAFDATGVKIYLDNPVTGTVGSWDAGDAEITYLDEAAADTTYTVFVVGAIPTGLNDGDVASGTLTGTAAAGNGGTTGALGTTLTQTAGAETAGTVDTVFGDVAGDTDAARDGKHSDDSGWRVRTAKLVVTKSSKVISDPFNNTTNPKRIPGAVIEYCIDVENQSTTTAADTVVISDAIPTGTTYVPASIRTAVTGTGTACDTGSGNAEDDDAAGADETDLNGADYNVTAAGKVTVRVNPNVGASSRGKALFRVTIDN